MIAGVFLNSWFDLRFSVDGMVYAICGVLTTAIYTLVSLNQYLIIKILQLWESIMSSVIILYLIGLLYNACCKWAEKNLLIQNHIFAYDLCVKKKFLITVIKQTVIISEFNILLEFISKREHQ